MQILGGTLMCLHYVITHQHETPKKYQYFRVSAPISTFMYGAIPFGHKRDNLFLAMLKLPMVSPMKWTSPMVTAVLVFYHL